MADNSPTPSRRESEYNSERASHGSVSTRPRSQDSFTGTPGFSRLDSLSELAAPAPVVNFFDEGAIRRQSSMDLDSTQRNMNRSTWPLKEHYLPGIASTSSGSPKSRRRSEQTSSHHSTPKKDEEKIEADNFQNLDEVAGPAPVENRDESSTVLHTTLEQSRYPVIEQSRSPVRSPVFPTRERSEGDLIQARKSSRRKVRVRQRKTKEELEKANKVRLSGQPSTPQGKDIAVAEQGPGSKNREEDATALPSYPYSVENLEEQLAAAQQLSITSSDLSQRRERVSQLATELYTISHLIFFSILGTLARLGTQWLTTYPGAPVVTPVLWANFAGSLFMGFLSEDRRVFREEWGSHSRSAPSFQSTKKMRAREEEPEDAIRAHSKIKKTIPLYIGLATGFCGSFTSFSSFMRDIFLALSNNLPTPINHAYPSGVTTPSPTSTIYRNGGYSFLAILAIVFLTLTLCLSALKVGAHIAIALDPYIPTLPFTFLRKFFDRFIVFLGFGCWLGAIFLAIFPPASSWRGQAVFACVFAPLGCLTRFYASLYMNGLSASFPLGTFAVNTFGTAILGMAYDLQHVHFASSLIPGGGVVGCQVLQGIMDGFCGTLTTVSTWVLELSGLRRAHAYFYGGASVVSGASLLVVIMGSVRWGVGWTELGCVV